MEKMTIFVWVSKRWLCVQNYTLSVFFLKPLLKHSSTATAIIFVAPLLPAEQPRFDRWRPPRSGLCVCANTARRRRRRRRSTFLSIMFGKEMPNKNLSLYQTVFVQTGDERGRGKKNDQSGRDARVVHADFFISQRGRHHHHLVGWSNPSLLSSVKKKREEEEEGQNERRHKKF